MTRKEPNKYGFICSGSDDTQLPFCLEAAFSNEALVPSKLKRHLVINHPTLKDKPKENFKNSCNSKNKQAKPLTNYIKLPEKGLIVSYTVAQLLAK